MGFFDLNIPYLESDKHITDKSTRKTTRLKVIVKAMELGYTGVAYNHTIKGVMSESDRCPISLFPLSSLLKLSPYLSTSVNLHRQVLGVPLSTPFRQYTRLTVTLDTPSQASALNSANPILKTYDIVAVSPINQNSFDQACKACQVDLIAIDFSEKLPFRLKQHNVKAAIERGVYFEITYSGLVIDAQVRRQMICSAKLLVDWTRGKNLIFSSAAPSVTELRGPYDVANLSSLLGIPTERAKAAISKNCRTLIANALRKKQIYKEAIRVEVISSGEQFDSAGSGFDDWLKWDPISSGEGDLLLDEMERSFRASSKVSKTVKAIDFASVVDGLPSHGLQIKDLTSTKAASEPPDTGKNFSAYTVSEQPERLNIPLDRDQTPLSNSCVKKQISISENSKISFSATDTQKGFSNAFEIGNHAAMIDGVTHTETEVNNFESQNCITICETHVILPGDDSIVQTLGQNTQTASASNDIVTTEISTPSEDIDSSASIIEESKRLNRLDVVMDECNIGIDKHVMLLDDNPTIDILVKDTEIASSKDVGTFAFQSEEFKGSDSLDVVTGVQNVSVGEMGKIKSKLDLSLASCDVSLDEGFLEIKQFREIEDGPVTLADDLPIFESDDAMQNKTNYSVANHEAPEEVTMEERSQYEDHTRVNYSTLGDVLSGKCRVKRRTSHRPPLFPFKRLLNPVPLKKQAQKFKKKI